MTWGELSVFGIQDGIEGISMKLAAWTQLRFIRFGVIPILLLFNNRYYVIITMTRSTLLYKLINL